MFSASLVLLTAGCSNPPGSNTAPVHRPSPAARAAASGDIRSLSYAHNSAAEPAQIAPAGTRPGRLLALRQTPGPAARPLADTVHPIPGSVALPLADTVRQSPGPAVRPPADPVASLGPTSGRSNPNDLGLVSDDENGLFARVAADLHTELGRDRVWIRPSASDGPLRTLEDILHRPGADVGIVQADALEALTLEDPKTTARRYLRYIARIYDQDVHVVAREGVASLRELDSRAVNIGRPESGSHITARLLFDKLGIKPDFTTHDTAEAFDLLRSGAIAAVFVLAPRPAADILGFDAVGFHLLSVPWEDAVLQSYRPSDMVAKDYPTLIREGERIETVAVDTVLAAYNWREGTAGHRRLTRFARSFFSRLGELRQPGHHFAWDAADLAAEVAGWDRFIVKGEPHPTSVGADSTSGPRGSTRQGDGG